MALVRCPKCGAFMSSDTDRCCPSCGYTPAAPVSKEKSILSDAENASEESAYQTDMDEIDDLDDLDENIDPMIRDISEFDDEPDQASPEDLDNDDEDEKISDDAGAALLASIIPRSLKLSPAAIVSKPIDCSALTVASFDFSIRIR